MSQGLATDEQRKIAEDWVNAKMAEARALFLDKWEAPKAPPNAPEGFEYTDAEKQDLKNRKKEENQFYKHVEALSLHMRNNPAGLATELDKFKTGAIVAIKNGQPIDIGAVFTEAFTGFDGKFKKRMTEKGVDGFDWLHPFKYISALPGAMMGAMWDVATSFIGNLLMKYAGEETAAMVKAFKYNYMDLGNLMKRISKDPTFKEMTVKEAEDSLRLQNGSKALAQFLGKRPEEFEIFGKATAGEMLDPTKPWAPKTPALTELALAREITQDHLIDKKELLGVIGAAKTPNLDRVLVDMLDPGVPSKTEGYIILTPESDNTTLGAVIYAKKAADGKLSDIQVAIDDKFVSVPGDFKLSAGQEKAIGEAIINAARNSSTPITDTTKETILIDDIVAPLRGLYKPPATPAPSK